MNALLAVSHTFQTSPWRFIALMAGGFALGVVGHLYGSRLLVAIGVAIVFAATFLLPLAFNVYR